MRFASTRCDHDPRTSRPEGDPVEREFQFNIDGTDLVRYIVAVYRTLGDELVVIDFKATERHRDLDHDKQLPIYLLACRELHDESIRRSEYAYVDDIGIYVESRMFSDAELQLVEDDVAALMNEITELSFDLYSAGELWEWCQHNQLSFAPAFLSDCREFGE